MGKSEERSGTTTQTNNSDFLAKTTEASKMLEAALLQMDGILSGACAEGAADGNTEWKDTIKDATRNLVTAIKSSPNPLPPTDATTVEILLQWMQPACLLGYTRMLSLQGSIPNLCQASSSGAGGMSSQNTAGNHGHLGTMPLYAATQCSSVPSRLAQLTSTDHHLHHHHHHHHQPTPLPMGHSRQLRCSQQNLATTTQQSRTNGTNLSSTCQAKGSGSLDRRRRRLRNRVERDLRAKSQSDLSCCGERQHCCPLQQFQYGSAYDFDKTEERLRKLENERAALHMEVSVLSEQVDAQSSKIRELESMLQEKKDGMRQLEEALQKEVLSRSALETQKLELLSSLSEMKLRQASLEHENLALRNSSPLSNGERFSRHTGQYSSLPRPPTSARKGVNFGKVPNLIPEAGGSLPLAVRGASARCLSAPILVEEKTVIGESSSQPEPSLPPKSLGELTVDEIGEWLAQIGLECYIGELKRWGATGVKLLDTTQNQIEKELDIKNILHRKKLMYAIESERCNGEGFLGSEKMDSVAVLRWLDDIGLPQHKQAFHDAKVDGRVLHRLTTEDLLNLGVTAQLHAASLRRGIQVLRELNFEFDNLERRSLDGNGIGDSNVTLWTNHRVMEWLRVVDLAEYAPNMRGSGVHGGLMVYEGRFTSELLATLLSIPPAKTLLRRHLTTHFNQILGREVVQQKREIESTLGFVPLTLTARLKVPKKSQFTLKRKKSKNEIDYGNLVCPLEASPPDLEDTGQRKVIGCI